MHLCRREIIVTPRHFGFWTVSGKNSQNPSQILYCYSGFSIYFHIFFLTLCDGFGTEVSSIFTEVRSPKFIDEISIPVTREINQAGNRDLFFLRSLILDIYQKNLSIHQNP